MANRAWAVARKLERNRLALLGKPLNTAPDTEMVLFVAGRLEENYHHVIVDEIRHQMQRRSNAARYSDVEAIGDAWRKAHGFGRPFFSGNAPGKAHGYGYGESIKDAAERARARKSQKAARVRDRLANGARRITSGVKRLFRGASRGA